MIPTFGQLRSALHASLDSRHEREELLKMLLQRHRDDPEAYQDQWLPYLSGFTHTLPDPFGTVRTLDAVEDAVALLPNTRFRLSLSCKPIQDVIAIINDPRLEHISSLCLYSTKLDTETAIRLLQSPALDRVVELDIGGNRELSVEKIFSTLSFPDLHTLDIHNTACWNRLEIFSKIQPLPSLRILDLGTTYERKETMEALHDMLPHVTKIYYT